MSYDRRTLASDSPFAVGAAFLLTVAAVMMLAILPQRLRDGSMAALTLLPLLPSAACICTAVMLVSRKTAWCLRPSPFLPFAFTLRQAR